MSKRLLASAALLLVLAIGMSACTEHDSDIVSRNLSTEADQFKIARRIVFYNGITGEYMLVIQGLCALGNDDPRDELTVVCKIGPDKYKKSFLGLSDNVTFFVEQIDAAEVSNTRYTVIFKPSVILPDIDYAS